MNPAWGPGGMGHGKVPDRGPGSSIGILSDDDLVVEIVARLVRAGHRSLGAERDGGIDACRAQGRTQGGRDRGEQ
jgi:hypothetical protein